MVGAISIDARDILDLIRALGITHVVTVPDTHQRTLLSLLENSRSPRLITVCTEDEAIGINAGLVIGGMKPLVLIQNNGLYACLNSVKAISLDAGVSTLMLIGEHGRDRSRPSRQNAERSVHLLEPTLELWNIPYYRLEGPRDLNNLRVGFDRCQHEGGPVAILVGAPTAEVREPRVDTAESRA